jgi:hypothetical protein
MRRRDRRASRTAAVAAAWLALVTLPASAQDELPAGHPAVGSTPHGHAGAVGGSVPGVFEPPEDTEQPDPTLPPGTIVVELRDADDKPVSGVEITLGMLVNSVAKGDSRKHVQANSDAQGRARFDKLETASNIAYRVSVGYQGGAFAATPFQLQQAGSMRVVLHVYPVTRDIQQALIVEEVTLMCEVREDRVQIEQVLGMYNLGRTAWQPDDVRMKLPEGFTGFSAQASMSDQGVDDVGGSARMRGTFPPGRHSVEFRWQVPWSGDKDVDFDVGMPPHVAIARVMLPATGNVKLSVEGFPPAETRHDAQGQSFLVTERRVRPDDPKLSVLSMGIHDLPTQGPGKYVASVIAALGVTLGLTLALSKRGRGERRPDATAGRGAILEELAELERARTAGDVGPKTYERARRELIDALARTLVKI